MPHGNPYPCPDPGLVISPVQYGPSFPLPFVVLQYLACGLIAVQICVLFSGLIVATGSSATFINSVIMAQVS